MIFYLAALQAIPPSLHEAAAVEGASRAYAFFRVTLPLLGPTTLFILVNAVINAFRLVDHIIVMTRGGPALLMTYIYDLGFRFLDTASASALTMVLLGLLAVAAAAQFLMLEKRTHYR
jgi:sn-glycerol 3-phosphate transport system permease protein